MTLEPNLFLVVRGARQIPPGRDTDGVTLHGERPLARVGIAAAATCLASVELRS